MLSESTVSKILDHGRQQGADFTEVFVEDSIVSNLTLLDRKIDEINSTNSFGVGVRLRVFSRNHVPPPNFLSVRNFCGHRNFHHFFFEYQ